MIQTDRYYYNLLFERRNDGSLHLAPIYDFGFSLNFKTRDDIYLYDSCLKSFPNEYTYKDMFELYPEFRDMIESYLDIDLVAYIKEISSNYHLNDDCIDYKFYKKINKEMQKRLKRILK